MWIYCCLCVCFMSFVDILLFKVLLFFFKQKTAYEMRSSDWSSDVCSSDLKQFGHRWIRSFLKTRGYSPEFSAILKADFWKIFSSGIWSARFTGSRRSSIAASELRILILLCVSRRL